MSFQGFKGSFSVILQHNVVFEIYACSLFLLHTHPNEKKQRTKHNKKLDEVQRMNLKRMSKKSSK